MDILQRYFNLKENCQAPLSMGFSRQEYWSGLPCPPPGGLPDPGTEALSLMFTCIGRWGLYHQHFLIYRNISFQLGSLTNIFLLFFGFCFVCKIIIFTNLTQMTLCIFILCAHTYIYTYTYRSAYICIHMSFQICIGIRNHICCLFRFSKNTVASHKIIPHILYDVYIINY